MGSIMHHKRPLLLHKYSLSPTHFTCPIYAIPRFKTVHDDGLATCHTRARTHKTIAPLYCAARLAVTIYACDRRQQLASFSSFSLTGKSACMTRLMRVEPTNNLI